MTDKIFIWEIFTEKDRCWDTSLSHFAAAERLDRESSSNDRSLGYLFEVFRSGLAPLTFSKASCFLSTLSWILRLLLSDNLTSHFNWFPIFIFIPKTFWYIEFELPSERNPICIISQNVVFGQSEVLLQPFWLLLYQKACILSSTTVSSGVRLKRWTDKCSSFFFVFLFLLYNLSNI